MPMPCKPARHRRRRTSCELADIFLRYGEAYQQTHRLRPAQRKAVLGDHPLPHGRLGRPPRVVPGLRLRAVHLPQLPQPPLPQVPEHGHGRLGGGPPGKNSCRCPTFTTCSRCRTS